MLTITRHDWERTYILCPDGSRITLVVRQKEEGQYYVSIDAPLAYQVVRDNAKNREPRRDRGN